MENIFQSKAWEEFKLKTGYQKSYSISGILVLQKNLPLGYSMLYSPMVSQKQIEGIRDKEFGINEDFLNQIKELGKKNKAIFYRMEYDFSHNPSFLLPNSSFKKSFEEMQPEHTLILDLNKDMDTLLREMKPKGRYNIRVAQKNEISVEAGTTELVDDFYQMYSETGKRHGITYRSKNYFVNLVQTLAKENKVKIFTAYKEIDQKKTALASVIIIYSGKTAIYMFGASSDQYKNLMAPYLLHDEAIRDSIEKGYKKYDFFGIAPNDDKNHPWAGVTRFKKQFGGSQVDILGSFDLVLKPLMYQLFKIAEKIRR